MIDSLPERLVSDLRTPALVVFMDAVRHNIDTVLSILGEDPDRWRPHVKTCKMAPVVEALVDRGIRSVKCATVREAALVADVFTTRDAQGDVLVAYALPAPNLSHLSELVATHPRVRFSVLWDSTAAPELPPGVSVFVDVNTGMDRTGVSVSDAAGIRTLAARAGSAFGGLHGYDGHLMALPDAERERRTREGLDALAALGEHLATSGIGVPEIVTSGSPTFEVAARHPALPGAAKRHRVSPGTVLLHDIRSAAVAGGGLALSTFVASRVVSHPAPGIVTMDAGSKAVAVDAGHPACEAVGHPGLTALVPSEEHLPFRVAPPAQAPPIGTLVLLAPRHVCPTVNLAEEAILVNGDGSWRIAAIGGRAHAAQPPELRVGPPRL